MSEKHLVTSINRNRDNDLLLRALNNPNILSYEGRAVYDKDLPLFFKDDVIDPQYELDTYALMVAQGQYEKTVTLYDKKILIMLEALKEIAEGRGPYNIDPLKHADNCIQSMVQLAKEAITKVGELNV